MKIQIIRSGQDSWNPVQGDGYSLAVMLTPKLPGLIYCRDNAWRPLRAAVKAGFCVFDLEDDARDVAEAVVHVPGDYRSCLNVSFSYDREG